MSQSVWCPQCKKDRVTLRARKCGGDKGCAGNQKCSAGSPGLPALDARGVREGQVPERSWAPALRVRVYTHLRRQHHQIRWGGRPRADRSILSLRPSPFSALPLGWVASLCFLCHQSQSLLSLLLTFISARVENGLHLKLCRNVFFLVLSS